jgi:hypothetical protein
MIFTRDRRARNYICSQSGEGAVVGVGEREKGRAERLLLPFCKP